MSGTAQIRKINIFDKINNSTDRNYKEMIKSIMLINSPELKINNSTDMCLELRLGTVNDQACPRGKTPLRRELAKCLETECLIGEFSWAPILQPIQRKCTAFI